MPPSTGSSPKDTGKKAAAKTGRASCRLPPVSPASRWDKSGMKASLPPGTTTRHHAVRFFTPHFFSPDMTPNRTDRKAGYLPPPCHAVFFKRKLRRTAHNPRGGKNRAEKPSSGTPVARQTDIPHPERKTPSAADRFPAFPLSPFPVFPLPRFQTVPAPPRQKQRDNRSPACCRSLSHFPH